MQLTAGLRHFPASFIVLAMFALLLLLAGQDAGLALSPPVTALLETRERLPPGEFVRRIEALALQGDASAAELAGEGSSFGQAGWPQDPAKACGWFERAASQRGDAAHNLALCYETGRGKPQDLAKARSFYADAARLGWVQAKCALGTMLVAGRGGAKDEARGVALCREAAEAGNANAQTDYGGWLLTGQHVPTDMVAARRWLSAAAGQGQHNAEFLLGQMLWNGDGGPADPQEAEAWWEKAYAGGRKDAAALLVRATLKRAIPDGKTVTDREALGEAVKWMERAAAEDPDPAVRERMAGLLKTLGGE